MQAALDASVLASLNSLAGSGRALDLAAGHGRYSLELARRGYEVLSLDRNQTALDTLNKEAERLQLNIETELLDLETASFSLPPSAFDLILVVNYLWRPLMPILKQAIRPGGYLLYETFTVEQARIGKPKNPDFLLRPGELQAIFGDFEVKDSWERVVPAQFARAHLLARKPQVTAI